MNPEQVEKLRKIADALSAVADSLYDLANASDAALIANNEAARKGVPWVGEPVR